MTTDRQDEWIDDPFAKLDEMGLDMRSEISQVTTDAYEAKIAEAPAREAAMNSIFPREVSDEEKMRNTTDLKSPMGEVMKEFAYPMHDEDRPSKSRDEREQLVQRTIANIHAVAKHLLSLNETDAEELYVGVQPLGNFWRVEVKYAGFVLSVKEPALGAALEKTLAKLVANVGRRLDDGMKLIAALDPLHVSKRGTRDAIAEAVGQIANVANATFTEGIGEIGIRVTPTRVLLNDEAIQLGVDLGAALATHVAFPIKFNVTIGPARST